MHFFKWLTDKAGKMPVTIAQAAGLTAVVGAAGFAALSYLNTPADNNNTFMPPSQYGGDVVYVSQNTGGGSYESNGEVGSSFKAAPSRAIQLANRQEEQERLTRALEESSGQPYSGGATDESGASLQMPKAYELSGVDVGLGMGGNKNAAGSFDVLTSAQNQLSGLGDLVAKAAQSAGAGQPGAAGTQPGGAQAPAAPGAAAQGKTAASLASASHNWGSNGLTRAGGGGGGSSNAFVIQRSGRKDGGTEAAAAVAQAGDALAQAQAAMNHRSEGARIGSQARFGRSDNLTVDRDASAARARRIGRGRNELSMIRKQSAEIAKSKTKSANEGARPFLASTQLSGGLTVSGDNITIGQDSSSGDLSNHANAMRGINAGLAPIGTQQDDENMARDELLSWFWTVFPAAIAGIFAIGVLVKAAKAAPGWWSIILYALAAVLSAVLLGVLWLGLAPKIKNYLDIRGSADGWVYFGYAFSGVLSLGVAGAWIFGPKMGEKTYKLLELTGPLLGFTGLGSAVVQFLTDKDQYLTDEKAEEAKQKRQQEEMENQGGDD